MNASTGKTVVVTDDSAELRELTANLIARRGHSVRTADSGVATLDIFKAESVDLLVLDVMMPDMNGYATLQRVRELGHTGVPVILLTAQDSDEELIAGYQAGVDYYLTKPYKPSALLNIVDFLIGDLSAEERAKLEAKL